MIHIYFVYGFVEICNRLCIYEMTLPHVVVFVSNVDKGQFLKRTHEVITMDMNMEIYNPYVLWNEEDVM